MAMEDTLKGLLAGLPDDVKVDALMSAVKAERRTAPAFGQDVEKTLRVLRERYERLLETQSFELGQLVRWKEGLKHKKRPVEGEPAVVLEVLDPPIRDESKDAGTPYFREPLDIVLGILDEDGDFVAYHFDSRRFEPFPESAKTSERS